MYTQISDLFFIVRERHIEKDNIKKIEKEWYSGYIGFLNVTFNNQTHDMMSIYDKKLYQIINKKNLRRLDESYSQYKENNTNICFIKLEFYQNGEIKIYPFQMNLILVILI